jgi:hypothetical protein
MADYPSFAVLPKTGAIEVTWTLAAQYGTIDRINFFLERSGYYTELRLFFQSVQQVFTLPAVPEGGWTLIAMSASGATGNSNGASSTLTVGAGATTEINLDDDTDAAIAEDLVGIAASSTLLNRSNSYSWLGDAETYFNTRYGASAWAGLAASAKEDILITAASVIDNAFKYVGSRLDSGQTLEFPRFLRRGDLSNADDMRFIPREVFEAVMEQAWSIYNSGKPESDRKQLQAEGVSSISIGRVSESYLLGAGEGPNINAFAKDKLKKWIARTQDYNGAFSPYETHS